MNATPAITTAVRTAVHKRDHTHASDSACHPHCVELINLGCSAAAVCHDCSFETDFSDDRFAVQAMLREHESRTKAQ